MKDRFPVRVRSRFSGREGVAYVNDPKVFVDGPGVTGWYRRSAIVREFIVRKTDRPSKKRGAA